MESVIASSSVDNGISCWDLRTGAEQLHHKSCVSPPHGLTCVGDRFLASSQLRDSSSTSGSIVYWSWNKPQVGVRSFPSEPINPLVSNREGTFIFGGGVSGDIFVWEVAHGRLLKKWRAHYRAVTCLVLSEDESLLISGSEDGCVRAWSLFTLFDETENKSVKNPYMHSFSEHNLRVTDIVSGYGGGGNAIVISSSEDLTCKVWSLSKGVLLRDVVFRTIIDSIALDPSERVFYAGGRDGKIYIVSLTTKSTSTSNYGMHILGALSDHSKAVTCLALSTDGSLLVSGLEDGTIRIWDTKTHQIIRLLKHSKGPVNNLLVVRQSLFINPHTSGDMESSFSRRHATSLPLALEKYMDSTEVNDKVKPLVALRASCDEPLGTLFHSCTVLKNQIKELERQGSAAASEMESERLRLDCKRLLQMAQQWKKMYEDLHHFCLDEVLDGHEKAGGSNENIN
ncbi:hypothetical protein Sjap_010115 [Stephania japonica]|uniref:Uncharacterized protein n=1 Tax=Stephania japonica TaxID=461633 RepID=A0AAP0J902_9MAGN